jgi:iron complex outermembrane receptor protein
MSTFRSLPFILLSAATFAQAQSISTPASSPPEKTVHLESFVVSAGLDGKTAFDLAQGTSILAGDELRRRSAATLGATLADTAGVSETSFGPNASRPIIRGLGGDRVRVLSSGIGSLDASSISPDHNTALEPLFASRIEVLRGPATLLYGSSAVGGAINVIDNRIPETPGDGQAHGAIEGRFGGAANERTGVAALGAANAHFGVQVDVLQRNTDDIDIPGVARIDANAPANQPHGTLPSSASETRNVSAGATTFWSAGRLGAAVTQYETVYGVPTGDDPGVTINMKQTRFDLDGDITQPFGIFRSAKLRVGTSRYRHSELDGDEVATSFKNNAYEGRLELPHVELGGLTGTIGAQGAFSDFSALGEEVVTPPSRTSTGALFAVEELKTSAATFQFGARYERQSVKLGAVDPSLPFVPGYSARSGQIRSLGGVSSSIGVVLYPAPDYSLGVSLAYSERLPTAQELFSNGSHGGTGAYEVGNSGLGRERSLGLDLSLRRRAGEVTGTVGVFINKFSDYIFEQQLAAGTIPAANNPNGLTEYQFTAKDALFYGAEAEVQFHLIDRENQRMHVSLLGDTVHAEQTTDDVPLPRMPPFRLGVGLALEQGRWSLGTEARHAFRQNRFGPGETATSGYTLLNAHVNYHVASLDGTRLGLDLFVRGDNLTDATARVSTSFLKDFAPLPGRGVTFGARLTF